MRGTRGHTQPLQKQGKTERSSAPKLTQGATPTRLGTQRIPGQTDCGQAMGYPRNASIQPGIRRVDGEDIDLTAQPARQGIKKIAGAEVGVAEAETSSVVLAQRRRVRRDIDTPDIRGAHLVGDGKRDRACTGCNIDGDTLSATPSQRPDRLLGEQLARRSRDENTFSHQQIEPAKRVVALDARNRLTVDPPRHHCRKPFPRRAVEHAVEESWCELSAEHLCHQLLRVVAPEVAVPMVDRRRPVDLAYCVVDVLGDGCGGHCPRMVSARMTAARTMFWCR